MLEKEGGEGKANACVEVSPLLDFSATSTALQSDFSFLLPGKRAIGIHDSGGRKAEPRPAPVTIAVFPATEKDIL